MIELLSIPNGYDENNIYNFANSDREKIFDKYVVKTIEDSFYPPHYRNTINLSTDDFFIYDSNFNYVRITIDTSDNQSSLKTYYYFVREIRYINDSLFTVYLEMDTITTFFYNILLSDVCIARKFIDRYNADYTINRNYLRENVSIGAMKQIEREYLVDNNKYDQTEGLIIIKLSDSPYKKGATNYCKLQSIRYLHRFDFVPQNGYYCILPFNETIITSNVFQTIALQDNGDEDINGTFEFHMSLTEISKSTKVSEIYMIPGNPLSNYIHIQGNKIYYHSDSTTYTPIDRCCTDNCDIFENKYSVCFLLTEYTINTSTIEFPKSIGFKMNTGVKVSFDKMNVPCLLDSNYYRISFGERNYQCTTLLEYSLEDSFDLTYQGIIDGTRFYFIDIDDYYTSVLADTKFLLTLYTSQWNNYNAYYKSSIGMALGNYALSCFAFGYGTNSNLSSMKAKDMDTIGELYSSRKYLDKRYKLPTLNTKALKIAGGIYENEDEQYRRAQVSSVNKSIGDSSSLVSTATQEYNAWLSPNTVRASYDYDNVYVSRAKDLVYVLYQVEDIEQVAQYYHRNGYLVNEYYSLNTTLVKLTNYITNRYYFNILKLANCNVNLQLNTVGEDIKQDIEYRLKMGIRLWDYDKSSIGDYTYDNVERKYIK